MVKKIGLAAALTAIVAALGWSYPRTAAEARQDGKEAVGIVFHDRNRNGARDSGEPGLRGVRVSNQRDIVQTDAEGRYRLPVTDDTILFVVKPRGWMTPLNKENLPQFYYIHKPNGSPKQRFPGVAPTGPLPASVDFPLTPQREPNRFRAILFGDPQPRDKKEVEYIAHDVVESLVGVDAAFGVTLGDIVFDDLDVFHNINRTIALIGIPWYNVIGNHDINRDSPDDKHANETYASFYGPAYYSYDYGPTHFIVLDDVEWTGAKGDARGSYRGGIGPEQMEFIRNDLALIPKEQMVVLMMHIPLVNVADRQELYRLIEQRPFAISISGHTHYQEHKFITQADGWQGPKPHHHLINVTVCGSWWSGAPDENGIPNTTMRCGAPNGYSILTFDGVKYNMEFRAARRPASHQMNIYAPEEVSAAEAGQTEALANVFFGSEKSKVEMRLGETGPWVPMEKIAREDPYFQQMKKLEEGPNPPPGRKLPGAMKSPHLWRGMLPENPPVGTRLLHVRTKDMFGKTYQDQRVLTVR